MNSSFSPAMVLLIILTIGGTFILWSQLLDLITKGRILKRQPFTSRWQKSLNLITTMAPLAGLLGTVSGLRSAFSALGSNEQQLAAGLSEALITTKIGLVLALLCLLLGMLLRRISEVKP